jgi:protoporphyrinogen oxidase
MGGRSFAIIGGGPAGLTAAYELTRLNYTPVVFEKGSRVGGIARTEEYKKFHFDMGGHRFFTKSEEVNQIWKEVLLEQFLRRPRLSRIYYRRKFFNYPLKPINALLGLGMVESVLIMFSYVRWKMFPYKQEETFEEWVTNRFGKRLFLTFFKTYTEKVWGISCTELKAEWAAQRIKDLSLKTALLSMFVKPGTTIKTLIDQFDYPRLGPGMMWAAVRTAIENRGATVEMETDVVRINRDGMRITSLVTDRGGKQCTIEASDFVSSMPVTEFIKKLNPPAPPEVLEAAGHLKYRDFLTVCLIINKTDLFPDNWIYIHDPSVNVGRIQNFKNWSPEMVPDQSKTSLGLEYFCTEGDKLWTMADKDLVELGKEEIEKIGLARAADVEDGCVFRVPKSYPIYDSEYRTHLDVVRKFMDSLANCRTIGRNGLHRYNNQDHAMLTGLYAVRNMVLGGTYDLWDVNADKEYHEEVREERKPAVAGGEVEALLPEAALYMGRLDRAAMGMAAGIISGTILFAMTLWLTLKGGPRVGPTLALLGQFFPGYRVSMIGSVVGLLYGGIVGFVIGWMFAGFRNVLFYLHFKLIRNRAQRMLLRGLLEYI